MRRVGLLLDMAQTRFQLMGAVMRDDDDADA